MAKRPAKAPESTPSLAFVPLRPDGTRATVDDVTSGTPLMFGSPGYSAGDRIIYPPALHAWLPKALEASNALFREDVPYKWHSALEEAMAHYFRNRLTELNAADETKVRVAIRAISATARKLKHQLDLPNAEASTYQAAWTRIERTRSDNETGSNLRDELYPAISLLISRLAMIEKRKTTRGIIPNSLKNLVIILAVNLSKLGITATGSNGIVRKGSNDTLSAFTRLVKVMAIEAGLPAPVKMTDTAINKAVQLALKDNGDDKG